ncbi:MAG: cytochrome c-type biogenesis protein CcmH [Alphaproteobacteria bacterium]|nr:cytochrome c-type biogenesis protein CcmH [Alphaproteobacteria bacterium]
MRWFVAAVAGVALLLTFLTALPALAVEPYEVMKDPAMEARARELSKELRCLVCQNQSIDDSAATLARDLRLLVRERIAAGDSDRQVLDYLTSRYGSFVLLKPPVKPATYLLWFGPALVLVLGGAGLFVLSRRRAAATAASAPLSDDERLRLAALLDDAEAPPAAAPPASPASRPRKAKGRA